MIGLSFTACILQTCSIRHTIEKIDVHNMLDDVCHSHHLWVGLIPPFARVTSAVLFIC